jgi:phenylphosphate carboxylase gamma subunit
LYKYDIFIDSLAEVPEGTELEFQVRDLTPGIHKYCQKWVRALVSTDPNAYPEKLLIRFGRGQEHNQPYSIKVISEINKIPEKFL